MRPEVTPTWSLVIPVKVLAQAKSRLTGLAATARAELALAMAADTVAAALAATAVGLVIVVTDDPEVGAQMAGLGAAVLPDEPAAGLNRALSFGAGHARGRWPGCGVAGLAGDLPALRPGELTAALLAAEAAGRAFVPDAEGTGTTLYAAAAGASFEPRFGPQSRARHLAAGAAELDLAELAGLRRDVDTAADLRLAAEIGLGPRTSALLAAARLPGAGTG
ncbi:MAG TPA: 2-phospho-L-lactate guanylyltransferase [Streptosporangiaceae bacterium]|nr:2-phospho-L-lactate guanylyltransferase [Streptosporangiaceae bacterium]